MAERIITAAEARALLAAARRIGDWYQVIEPDGDDDNGPDGGDYPTRHVYCEGEPVADCDTAAVAAAVASMPRVVAALERMEERRDHWIEAATLARGERDRLARVLAVERGDALRAPEGWTANYAGDMWTRTVSGRAVWIQRFSPHGVSMWELRGIRRDDPAHREWPTALEAMEAIDAGVTHAG